MRVAIDFPEKIIFTSNIPIRITDLNYGGHVGNEKILAFAQEMRALWMQSLGRKDESDLFGTSVIMADAMVQYHAEIFYGQLLKCEMSIDHISRSSFSLYYRFYIQNGNVAATAKSGMVAFDYQSKKVVPLTQEFLDIVLK